MAAIQRQSWYETKNCLGTFQKQLERKDDYLLLNIDHIHELIFDLGIGGFFGAEHRENCRWPRESAESKGVNRPKQETVCMGSTTYTVGMYVMFYLRQRAKDDLSCTNTILKCFAFYLDDIGITKRTPLSGYLVYLRQIWDLSEAIELENMINMLIHSRLTTWSFNQLYANKCVCVLTLLEAHPPCFSKRQIRRCTIYQGTSPL